MAVSAAVGFFAQVITAATQLNDNDAAFVGAAEMVFTLFLGRRCAVLTACQGSSTMLATRSVYLK